MVRIILGFSCAFIIAALVPMALPATTTEDVLATEMWDVTGSRVNVRSGPSTDSRVLGQVIYGDQVEVLEDGGKGWLRVSTPELPDAWVFSKYLAPTG